VTPTRIGTLVALLLGTAALAWGALQITTNRGGMLPQLTWTAPSGVALLAVAVLLTALALRSRLSRPEKRPHPLAMARLAVLGKANAHVGPIVGGLYAGYLLVLLPGLDIEPRRDRAVLCLVALLASLALSAAGLLLERLCRVPPSDADPDLPGSPA
jgi:hypothetical protein